MKKKSNTNKLFSKMKISEQRLTNTNNILINNEFGLIIHNFYDSFSRYIYSLRSCLKEINGNLATNSKIYLDESTKKCISSLNSILSYLDASFTQFYSNMLKYFEKINTNKYSKVVVDSNKEPIKLKNSASANFFHDNYSIYKNYKKNRLDNKNKNSYANTTTDMNQKESSINETVGIFNNKKEYSQSRNKNFDINNINGGSMRSENNFIEKIKNLLNILEYEKINDISKTLKTNYQIKLGKYKDNLITEISNSINDTQFNNPQHRRIKSFNINNDSINYTNNESDFNNNQLNGFIIQENNAKKITNIKELRDEINKDKSLKILDNNGKMSNCLSDRNIFESNNKNNLNIINNIKININKANDNIIQLEHQKIKDENDMLEKHKKDLLMQIADLITKNNTLKEEISTLKNTNKKLVDTENETNEIINEKNKKLELITNNNNEFEKNNQQLKKSIDLYINEIDKLKKEIKKLNDKINNIEIDNKENKKINKELTQENKNLEKEMFELDKEVEKLKNQINKISNKKDEYEEKYRKASKELNDEKDMNLIYEQKIKKLEKKLEEYNIIEFDDGKTKTYKLNNMNKVNEIEVEKLTRKYVSPYNFRKNTSVISTNNTSNTKKIIINNNLDDFEITPENYLIVKIVQLNNNLKWYLLKKIRKQSTEAESSPINSPNQSNSKHLFRRYKYLKINSKLFNESFSDYVWKPGKNDKDFINFNYATNDGENNKNENSNNSLDKQKKINELECCIKDLEEKLEKKENDCNRINLNFAKMFKKSKHPELNYDAVLENNEKLKEEIKNLKKQIDTLKASQQFIGLSFIEDDLEGSRFIDDKCFEEILDELVGNIDNINSKKANTFKRIKDERKFEINMMKFFRSHEDDDNTNKDLLKDNIYVNNKEDLNEINNDGNNNNNNNHNYNRKNTKTRENKINTDNKDENENNKDLKKYKFQRCELNSEINNDNKKDNKISDKVDYNKEYQNTKKNENLKTDVDKNENKKFLSSRFTRYRQRINTNQNENNNKNENIDSQKNFLKKVNFKNDKKDITNNNINNNEIKNEEIKNNKSPNKLIENSKNKKTENNDDIEPINKNIFINRRKVRKSYKKYQNNETEFNKNTVIGEEKNSELNKKEEKKETKPYRSVKSIKIETDYKFEKKGEGLQESSSQVNRVCFGRRFYKKKKEELKHETNEK